MLSRSLCSSNSMFLLEDEPRWALRQRAGAARLKQIANTGQTDVVSPLSQPVEE
jgi:hypothetical protein